MTEEYAPQENAEDFSAGYTVKGTYYPTLASLSRAFNVKVTTLSRRLRSSRWNIEQACGLTAPPKPAASHRGKDISVNGKTYPSMTAACAAYNIKTGIFHARRRNGWSIDEALGAAPRVKYSKGKQVAFSVDGRTFLSLRAACEAYNLKSACVRSRLAMGWTLEETFGVVPRIPPKRLTAEERSGESGTLVIAGKTFIWKQTRSSPVS